MISISQVELLCQTRCPGLPATVLAVSWHLGLRGSPPFSELLRTGHTSRPLHCGAWFGGKPAVAAPLKKVPVAPGPMPSIRKRIE